MNRIAHKINHYRRLARMTEAEAANRLGISEAAFKSYELGKVEPDFSSIVSLAHIFGVTTDQLLDYRVLP